MKRICNFLSAEEIDDSFIKKNINPDPKIALSMKNGNFSWRDADNKSSKPKEDEDSDEKLLEEHSMKNTSFSLQNIEFEIEKNSLVMIIGE